MRLYEEYKTAKGDDFYDLGYVSCRDNGLPHAITSMNTELSKLCFQNGLPHITVHGLRHPYVKPTTKKFITFFEAFRAAI